MSSIDLARLTTPITEAATTATTYAGSIAPWLQVSSCDNEDQANLFGNVTNEVAAAKKRYIEMRDGGLAPAKQLLAWIESLFPRAPLDLCDQVIAHLKSVTQQWYDQQRARAQELAAAATTPAEMQAAVAVLAPAPSGFVPVETWDFEIDDISKVPGEYFVLDTKRVAADVKRLKSAFNVPGLRAVMTKELRRKGQR